MCSDKNKFFLVDTTKQKSFPIARIHSSLASHTGLVQQALLAGNKRHCERADMSTESTTASLAVGHLIYVQL